LIDAPAMHFQVSSNHDPEMTVVGIRMFDGQIGDA